MFPCITTKKRFYEANKKKWFYSSYDSSGGVIFAVHGLSWHFEFSVLMDIVAKGLEEKYKLPTYGLSYGEEYDSFVQGDESFGIKGIYKELNIYLENQKNIDYYYEYYSDKQRIAEMTYRGIKCGDAIWDELISKSLEIEKVSKDAFIFAVKKAFAIIDMAYDVFSVYTPCIVVVDEPVRLDGLIAEVALRKYNANVLQVERCFPSKYPLFINQKSIVGLGHKYRIAEIESNWKIEYKNENSFLLQYNQFQNNNQKILDNGNICVYIMLHDFNDAPRTAVTHKLFGDYVEWFNGTLDIIKDINEVNWIIRNHPVASGNRQLLYVKEKVESLNRDNIFISDPKENRFDIIRKADTIITYSGDAGIEYWALGIPTISLAETYYTKYGISYLAKSIEDYKNMLLNIEEIKKPSEESIALAKKIMAIINSNYEKDDLCRLFSEVAKKEINGICFEYRDYDLYDYEFIIKYLNLLDSNKIKTSSCYTLEHLVEVR